LVENFDLLLKNTNISSKDAVKKTTDKQKFMTSLMYSTSLPLKKETNRHNNLFSPILSLRYSPNKTKNIRSDDRRMDSNNIFTLNRIGSGDTVEGGTSITLGANYSISRKNNDYALFSFGLAQNFRDNENEDLPLNSTIGKKSSDVFGNMNFKPNQYLDFDYNFAVDDALSKSKYDHLKGSLTINNFITSFEFLDDNTEDGQNYISSKTSYNFGGGNSLTFERRENKRLDLTEYYNLIYEYKNDCLIAGIEYNKQFYSDADLKPEEKLFFSITIVPFGTTTGPNINK
jgi:LPS-assembly protein